MASKELASKDSLDDYISAAADALALPLEPAWKPAVRTHLEITLKLARLVEDFELPDDAEPAPVFRT
jgi:1-carboxybiuret hydrolase subunit AtzG-like protein